MTELERLRYRVEELEQILGIGPDDVALIKRALPGIRTAEAEVLAMLSKRKVTLSKETIAIALYGGRPECDQPDPHIVDVYICRARATLRGTGIEIQTDWGRGYAMTPENSRKLMALIGSVQEIAA